MNSYITAQIRNMEIMLMTFEQACKLAATQDDGRISKEEEILLKKIKDASTKFKIRLTFVYFLHIYSIKVCL